jgi:hypothetical protein
MKSPHFRTVILFLLVMGAKPAHAQQVSGTLVVRVSSSNSQPIEQAEVMIADRVVLTNEAGEATFELPPGTVEVHVERYGFKPQTAPASI